MRDEAVPDGALKEKETEDEKDNDNDNHNREDPAGGAEALVATDAAPDGARAPHLALPRPCAPCALSS